ncbi:hypothetical protein JTE90_022524 [Oedothorax gibbosus]|uniref:Uncharacterized protein n=1 Tax=Oedothorax gibbosus TaxID=931172 RepID=A0AAV6UZP4_9ARAC|nr:hypothetical protein JTE90_022524 [Oedothorax gibbosus]
MLSRYRQYVTGRHSPNCHTLNYVMAISILCEPNPINGELQRQNNANVRTFCHMRFAVASSLGNAAQCPNVTRSIALDSFRPCHANEAEVSEDPSPGDSPTKLASYNFFTLVELSSTGQCRAGCHLLSKALITLSSKFCHAFLAEDKREYVLRLEFETVNCLVVLSH